LNDRAAAINNFYWWGEFMNDKRPNFTGPETLLQAWMKASTEFWNSMIDQRDEAPTGAQDDPSNGSRLRSLEAWESTMKTMRTFTAVATQPETLEGLTKGINSLPEVALRMIQPAWNGFFHLQQEWMRRVGRIGKTASSTFNFENFSQEAVKAFSELYEKEFRQFLQVPQLGLTRVYQERLSQVADRFNLFQTTMNEFLSLLYLPVEKSIKVMQDELASLADEGQLPETSKDFYGLWMRILEGHYMILFKSPEYTTTLGKTMDALSEFVAARQQILQDALQFLPIPTQKDMDELYKEIYQMKKRVKELEKQNKARGIESKIDTGASTENNC
jgi:class III poly(R)-hydroxyalkanoic acid synthase PhaE subunit